MENNNSEVNVNEPLAELKEGGFEETPAFYSSLTNNPTQGRLKDTDVRQRLPRITEYIDYSFTGRVVSSLLVGTGSTAERIPFKLKTYKTPPLVVGTAMFPDGTVKKIPARQWISFPSTLRNLDIQTISTTGIQVTYALTAALTNTIKLKLRVYNLDVTE